MKGEKREKQEIMNSNGESLVREQRCYNKRECNGHNNY